MAEPSPRLRQLSYLAANGEQEIWNAGVLAQANSSRTIEFDRFDLAAVAVHIKGDRTTTDFTILNR